MRKNESHIHTFSLLAVLGTAAADLPCMMESGFESFVCAMYGFSTEQSTVAVRFQLFHSRYSATMSQLGDVIAAGGGAGEASRARVRSAWAKFREQRVLVYGS